MLVKVISADFFPQAWYADSINGYFEVEIADTQLGTMYSLVNQSPQKFIYPGDCEVVQKAIFSPNFSVPFIDSVHSILTEREFQDAAVADPTNPVMINLQMGSTLAAIQLNLNKALAEWYSDSTPYPRTMHLLRKIAALCVQAGEKWGMPSRIIKTEKQS